MFVSHELMFHIFHSTDTYMHIVILMLYANPFPGFSVYLSVDAIGWTLYKFTTHLLYFHLKGLIYLRQVDSCNFPMHLFVVF